MVEDQDDTRAHKNRFRDFEGRFRFWSDGLIIPDHIVTQIPEGTRSHWRQVFLTNGARIIRKPVEICERFVAFRQYLRKVRRPAGLCYTVDHSPPEIGFDADK